MQDTSKNNTPFHPSPFFGGLFMIGMGLVFLAATTGLIGGQIIGLFFAIAPVLMMWAGAWYTYQANGRQFNSHVATFLLWSLIAPIAIIFYFTDINMANISAVSFIFVGITLILNRHHTR